MKKNMKLTVSGQLYGKGLFEHIKNAAEKNDVCGILQKDLHGGITIYLRGSEEAVECLIDAIYAHPKGVVIDNIHRELCNAAKDFRNVFRVIGRDEE